MPTAARRDRLLKAAPTTKGPRRRPDARLRSDPSTLRMPAVSPLRHHPRTVGSTPASGRRHTPSTIATSAGWCKSDQIGRNGEVGRASIACCLTGRGGDVRRLGAHDCVCRTRRGYRSGSAGRLHRCRATRPATHDRPAGHRRERPATGRERHRARHGPRPGPGRPATGQGSRREADPGQGGQDRPAVRGGTGRQRLQRLALVSTSPAASATSSTPRPATTLSW